jgi:thiol-disulfide isomerase/thioredoxin
MIFNRFIFILVTVFIVFSGCKKNTHFTITGKITHAEGDTIYLEEYLLASTKPVDQSIIDEKGRFELKGISTAPTFFTLRLSDQIVYLLLDSTENITIEADIANFNKDYAIEGSYGSQQIKLLNQHLLNTQQKLDSLVNLMQMYNGKSGYDEIQQKLEGEFNDLIKKQSEFSKKFILDNPFSMVSVYALYQNYNNQAPVMNDFQTQRTAASALNVVYPNNEFVKSLYENTVQLLNQQRSDELKKLIAENGANSPEIVLPDINGKNIALSSFQGKVVLLQFWAAEDPNSRTINSLLVDAYKKYKSKGFEIYQVNVGKNRSEWVDVIDSDKLVWTNVGDLEGSINAIHAYNIQSIPANYLLDQEGRIRAKNLRGTDLDRALAQLLN